MKTIYKFLFACVSGVINLVYHVHSARAASAFYMTVPELGGEYFYSCTPCNVGTTVACSLFPGGDADIASTSGLFYGILENCEGTAQSKICENGSFWDPVSAKCLFSCPSGGYLAADKLQGYWKEATTCTRRHYYGGVACSRSISGTDLDGWYDCRLYHYYDAGDVDHSATGVTQNVYVGGNYDGAVITDCTVSDFTTSRGYGVYDPLCQYTIN